MSVSLYADLRSPLPPAACAVILPHHPSFLPPSLRLRPRPGPALSPHRLRPWLLVHHITHPHNCGREAGRKKTRASGWGEREQDAPSPWPEGSYSMGETSQEKHGGNTSDRYPDTQRIHLAAETFISKPRAGTQHVGTDHRGVALGMSQPRRVVSIHKLRSALSTHKTPLPCPV